MRVVNAVIDGHRSHEQYDVKDHEKRDDPSVAVLARSMGEEGELLVADLKINEVKGESRRLTLLGAALHIRHWRDSFATGAEV